MHLSTIEAEAAACRAAFEGAEVGAYAWHVHHDVLAEHLTEPPEARIDYILAQKPVNEQALRLRLFRPVHHGEAIVSARRAWDEAVTAAWRAYYEAVPAAWRAHDEAQAAAARAYNEAKVAAHAAACPSCPWNGRTILSGVSVA